jgi:hypothetical protein
MTKRKRSLLALLSTAFAVLALVPGHASGNEPPDIEIISANMGGNGCPQGTASVVLSGDKRTMSILFDQYIAEDRDYKSCNIAVALRVPDGFTVALLDIDYRGYASIPDLGGRKARFRAEYFFAGGTGPVRVQNFPRGYEGSYTISHDFVGAIWAPCGADVITRANTSVRTWGDGTFVIVDSADLIAGGITFYLDWDVCW